jgi:hypothetical protein
MNESTPDAKLFSYHDLHITTPTIKRASIFDLPYGLMVTCTRTGGWELWNNWSGKKECIAGEYGSIQCNNWLILDVDGHVIVDSSKKPE